jgi:microsomal epoxide hydrolase
MASDKPWGTLPKNATTDSIKPFTVAFPEDEVKRMIDLLKLTRVASPVYENSLAGDDRHLGLRRDWLVEAKRIWETEFDWFVAFS